MKCHFFIGSLAAALFLSTGAVFAQDKPEIPAFAVVNDGELRLDGRIKAVLGNGEFSLQAVSFTSPRGVTKEFEEPKNKTIKLAPDGKILTKTGSAAKLEDVKLGTVLGIIGTNQPDGSVLTRTIILTGGIGDIRSLGRVTVSRPVSQLLEKGDAARDAVQTQTAADYYNQAVAAAVAIQDRPGERLSWARLGLLYFRLNQYPKALEAYTKSLDVSRAAGDMSGEAGAQNGLGVVYQRMGKYPEAVKAYEGAVATFGQSPPAAQVSYLQNLTYAYRMVGETAKAISTAERTLQLITGNDMLDEEIDAQITLAIMLPLDQTERIDGYLKKAKEQVAKLEKPKDRAYMWGRIATADLRLKRTDAAKEDMNKSASEYDAAGETAMATLTRSRITALQPKADQPATPAAGQPAGNAKKEEEE